jgi:GT2 family glycosyltransferase
VNDPARVPVSVLVRTIGRAELLRGCLESLGRCQPRAHEVVVVDQSRGEEVAAVVADFAAIGARVVASWERGTGLAFNVGLRAVEHEHVLVTDDDCTVAPDWVGRGWAHMSQDPEQIVTGRVLPAGDPDAVPSLIDDPEPRDYTGEIHFGALYTNNCCLNRGAVLAIGGFDELIRPVAEDNDLCYRWLRAGRPLRYEPDLVVWHHEWRSRDDLERWYVQYAKSQGMFYAKHLRRGDLRMLRFIAYDLFAGARGTAARLLLGRPRWSDAAQGILAGLPRGMLEGWRVFGANRGAGY